MEISSRVHKITHYIVFAGNTLFGQSVYRGFVTFQVMFSCITPLVPSLVKFRLQRTFKNMSINGNIYSIDNLSDISKQIKTVECKSLIQINILHYPNKVLPNLYGNSSINLAN